MRSHIEKIIQKRYEREIKCQFISVFENNLKINVFLVQIIDFVHRCTPCECK